MSSSEDAVHDGAAEGRHHAEADEHDGRHQLEAETGAAWAWRNHSVATPLRSRVLPEPRSNSAGSPPTTTCHAGRSPPALPAPGAACFMGHRGRRHTGSLPRPCTASRMRDEPGPPRGQQVLAVANAATKTLIMFHRKARAQTRAFLQDGLQGPRATGAEGHGGHLRMPEPGGERVPPV